MVDYTKATGSAGTMMIRDLGSTVEFRIRSSSASTFNNSGIPYTAVYNGNTYTGSFTYPSGSPWVLVRSFTITTSQTVQFNIGSSGTSGLGGPTNFSQYLDRAVKPSPPSKPVLSQLDHDSVYVTFNDGANGGATITSRQIGWGTSSSAPQSTMSSDRSDTVSGLAPGTKYYFWARTYNVKGWSNWSARAEAVTHGGAYINVGGVWKHAVPYVRVSGVWKVARPWSRLAGTWKETS